MCRQSVKLVFLFVALKSIVSHYEVSCTEEATRIRLISYNVQEKDPDKLDVAELLQLTGNATADIVAIGLQEVDSWATDYLVQVSYDDWSRVISKTFREAGYFEVGRERMAGIVLNVYAKMAALGEMKFIETESKKRGFGGVLSNKGAVGVSFFYRGTSVAILNSHLAAHQEKYKDRVKDYDSISKKLNFVKRDLANHDLVFWMGDLNFRIDNMAANEVADKTLDLNDEAISDLLANDQLTRGRSAGEVFEGYNEMTPRFWPTYKYIAGTDEYDLKRIPAYTDRIMYRAKQYGGLQVDQMSYEAHRQFKLSDHKPVSAEYLVNFSTS
ncbi:Phosphatidylinositol 4,5-bisphosphate 5-phosphatase A [Halotydeus destructor]|nr:Phosphatidylinositol 4,5-bisphosphate 5-phosphatase A [Halotydeus destructor]